MKVLHHVQAVLELESACSWYARRSPSAMARLRRAFQAVIARVAEHPDLYPEIVPGVRRAVLGSFPYQILYQVFQDRVIVVAVAHLKRESGYWLSRLANPGSEEQP